MPGLNVPSVMVFHINPFKKVQWSVYGENNCQVFMFLAQGLTVSVRFRLFCLDVRFAFEYRQIFLDSHVLTDY